MTSPKIETVEAKPSAHAEVTGPVIVDMGKQRRRSVKRLLRGEGKLMEEVRDCIAELRRMDKISASAEPVIFVVRQKDDKTPFFWPKL